MNDYASAVIVVVVAYDYFSTFSREMDYIWRRPWTRVSTMFVLVRYAGIFLSILSAFYGSTFLPGPQKVGSIVFLGIGWGFQIVLIAADFVMIMRVYAMWNRSKTIIFVLSLLYVLQVAINIVFEVINYRRLSVTVVHILDHSFCNTLYDIPSVYGLCLELPRFILGITLFGLATLQALRQSVEMYMATKQWLLNRYMQTFVREGTIYFVIMVLINATSLVAADVPGATNSIPILSLMVFSVIALFTMLPRFIIGIRELYDRDLRGNWQDTGFGALSQLVPSQPTGVSWNELTDDAPSQSETTVEMDESLGIQVGERGDNLC